MVAKEALQSLSCWTHIADEELIRFPALGGIEHGNYMCVCFTLKITNRD